MRRPRPAPPRVRSLLYVPGARPSMLGKLPGLPADAVVVDLEDGVAPDEKSTARACVLDAGREGLLDAGPPWWLRVNAVDSRWFVDDLELATELRPPGILLAKADSPDHVAFVGSSCSAWGGRLGLMIETARGVGRVRELAGCHPSVGMLVYGSADYRLAIGARPDPARDWERHALQEILLAARMHGCAAIDAVYFHFRDAEGLRREALVARDLGYDGKSCIHPAQVSTIHGVFCSSQKEIEWARKVHKAWLEQDGRRRGVVVADGEMIEALHLRVAERILARAPGDDVD